MRLRRLSESGNIKKIGITEYMYPEYDGLVPPDFGPGLEYHDLGDRLAVLMAASEDDPDEMVLAISLMDDDMDDYEYVYSHGTGRYPEGKAGYAKAKSDFDGACKALRRGEDPKKVAKGLGLVRVV